MTKEEYISKIKCMIDQGKTVIAISKQLKLNEGTVRRYMKKSGIKANPRKRTSIIALMPSEQLQKMLDSSSSFAQIFRKLKLSNSLVSHGSYNSLINQRIVKDKLDDSKFRENIKNSITDKNKKRGLESRKSFNQVFCENSNHSRHGVKQRIIKENLILYECSECGNKGFHNNKSLVLQLEHKNGINNDNRLENLCFLCPNCHSQTSTFAGRGKKTDNKLCICGKTIHNKSLKCRQCSEKLKIHKKKFDPTKEELQCKLIELNWNLTEVGNFYGVSDNSVKKRYKKFGLISPKNRKTKNLNFNPSKKELQNILKENNYNLANISKKFNIASKSISNKCKFFGIDYSSFNKEKIFNPDKNELISKMIQKNYNKREVGYFYGVSDSVIKYFCIKNGIKHSSRQ